MVSRVGMPHPPPVLPNLVMIFDLYLYVPLSECMSCYFRRGVSNEDAGRKGASAGNYSELLSYRASLSLSGANKRDGRRRGGLWEILKGGGVITAYLSRMWRRRGQSRLHRVHSLGEGKLCSALLVNSGR